MYKIVYAIFLERPTERIFNNNFYSDLPPHILALKLMEDVASIFFFLKKHWMWLTGYSDPSNKSQCYKSVTFLSAAPGSGDPFFNASNYSLVFSPLWS